MPEEAIKHADSVVIGPGEKTWPQLLLDFKNGTTQTTYQTNYINDSSIPVPKRELQANRCYIPTPTVIANRGCRNHCEFCSVHKLYGHNPTTRPIPEVIDEIRRLNTKTILFLDPSPTSNKEYAQEFFKALIPLKIKWGGLATTDIVYDKELFQLMVKSGCEGLLLGFESLSQPSLNRSGKSFNQVDKYREVVKILHDHQIGVLGCFVLGFDDDTRESLGQMVKMVDELKIDLPRYAVLTPFPGTKLFFRLKKENRILTADWSFYDTEHVVFRPKHMHSDELQQILYDTWQKTYRFNRIVKRVMQAKKNRVLSLIANLGFYHYARQFHHHSRHDWLMKGQLATT
jgi:radical SAM superfamily enzyme YgiQ (UPF0313 family)